MEQKENRVVLRGTAAGEATLSHQVHGLDFYRFPLSVPRLSGREDRLNILLPAPPEGKALPQPGDYLEVTGEVRSFNNRSGVGSRLVITVLARSVLPGVGEPCNQVWLRGTLCKPPILRRTPLGRDICDLLLAVNRRYPSGGLPALHRLGAAGTGMWRNDHRGPPVAQRAAAKPDLSQKLGRDHAGAHRL